MSHTGAAVFPVNNSLDNELTAIARETATDELVHTIFTRSSILAGITCTLIHITEAASIVVTTWTLALEAIHKVHANATICTWIAGTFIDVRFTVLASEPRDTIAGIPVQHIHKRFMKTHHFEVWSIYSNTL